MNVNLAHRLILRNHCKFKKLIKLTTFGSTAGARVVPILCEFSSFTQSRILVAIDEVRKNVSQIQTRLLSEQSGPPSNKLPQLMPSFPKIVWPSFIKSIRNFILATFIIKPYLDKEFTIPDFIAGSKKAVEVNFDSCFTDYIFPYFLKLQVVSRKLSDGEIKSLEGLVTIDIIPSLQKAVSLMNMSQREQIAINVDDIYFSFPYQVRDSWRMISCNKVCIYTQYQFLA